MTNRLEQDLPRQTEKPGFS